LTDKCRFKALDFTLALRFNAQGPKHHYLLPRLHDSVLIGLKLSSKLVCHLLGFERERGQVACGDHSDAGAELTEEE
jgi:hypothetical protein